MIILEAELRAALGLTDPDDLQQARLTLAMQIGHAAVRKYLYYDPEQRSGPAEFYPRRENYDDSPGVWDVNPSHTRAQFVSTYGIFKFLQLERLPVREVTEVLVDSAALHGQQAGDFGAGTEWTQGEDFSIEWDQENLCKTGMLIASGAWPSGIGTVKVTYRAGYSQDEFRGPASSSSTDANGIITTQGVDASPIKAAVLLTCIAKYLTLMSYSASQITGLHSIGPKSSERLWDYSYTLANAQLASMIAGMAVDVPPEAAAMLHDFIHYGELVL